MHFSYFSRSLFLGACLCAAAPVISLASDESVQLDPIVVQASPLGRTADELVQPVIVLSAEELARQRRSTIGETLENQPGVSTTDFGPGAGRPVIRGQGGPRIEVLENGVASMDASDVSTDHAVSIDPAHADQIEVLKGPATLLYGSGAAAGVVNISNQRLPTEVVEGLHGSIDGYFGSNASEQSGTAALGFGAGKHMFRGDFARKDADAYDIPGNARTDGSGSQGTLANSVAESQSGSLSYGYVSGGSSAAFSISQFETQYGLPVEPTAFIDMEQKRYDAQGILDKPLAGLESIKLRLGYNDYEHTEFEDVGVAGTHFVNQQSQQRIEAVHVPLAGWRGVFGVQNGHRDFDAIGEEAFVPPVTTDTLGLFLLEERPYSLGKLELGGRVERVKHEPTGNPKRDFSPVSLSLGSIFNLPAGHHFKVYAQRAQRAPVAEELYAFGPHGATGTFERGDVNLDLETAHNVEIGLDHHGERLDWELNAYYETIKDYVYLQETDSDLNADGSTGGDATGTPDGEVDLVDAEGAFVAPANYTDEELLLVDYKHADARFYGFEAEVRYALLTGPFNLSTRVFADSVRAKLDSGANLPRITPARFGAGLTAAQGPLSADLRFARTQDQKNLASLETPTAGYSMLSAELRYSFRLFEGTAKDCQLYLRGRNLLDEEVRRATSFLKDVAPAPGTSIIAGLSIPF